MNATVERATSYEWDLLYEANPNADAVVEHAEDQKSFNVLASVNMMRRDLDRHGEILAGTKEQIIDQELSLLAEGMNRAARTEFPLRREGNELVYFSSGEWKSYTGLLVTGLEVSKREAREDHRKQFLADDAVRDLEFGLQMRALRSGEQLIWASPYRQDIEDLYGPEFMKSCGRFPDRKMSFLYRAYATEIGTVVLESQTIDGNDQDAIDAALADPNADMDTMLAAHDTIFALHHPGERIYAGRTGSSIEENVWKQMLEQQDIIHYFITKLESLARSSVRGESLEHAVKRHTYGVWATFKKRIDNGHTRTYEPVRDSASIVHMEIVRDEVEGNFKEFVSKGLALVGCGGSIEIAQNLADVLQLGAEDVFKAIFGSKEDTDEYGPLVFKCKKGHRNRRPRGKLLTECQTKSCDKGSVGC